MILSQCRLKLRQLVNEQGKLLPILLTHKTLIKGGVYQTLSRCGKANCRCVREGILHPVWRLYWTEGGKACLRALRPKELYDYQKLTKNYMRFRKARARLVKIHQVMVVLVNQLEKGLTKTSVKAYVDRRLR